MSTRTKRQICGQTMRCVAGKVPPRPEPHTRETLARAVKDKFGVDIMPMLSWMQVANHLPKNLTSDWDPVWGPKGAWEHLRGRRSIGLSKRPEHGAGRYSLLGDALRPPCKLCGSAQVVLLCYYEAIAPNHAPLHMLNLFGAIESQIHQLRAMRRALATNVERYEAAQAEYLKGVLENATQREFATRETRSPEKNCELLEKLHYWGTNSDQLAQLRMYRYLKIDSWFEDFEEWLRAVQNDAINPRRPVQEAIWPPRAGRPTKMIAKLRTILKDDGFTWDEVAQLVLDDADIEDPGRARDRARSQVRAARASCARRGVEEIARRSVRQFRDDRGSAPIAPRWTPSETVSTSS